MTRSGARSKARTATRSGARSPEVMAISEAELSRMTRDLDQLHHDQSLPALRLAVSEWLDAIRVERSERDKDGGHGRRTFLLGAGAVAGASVLAACGSSNKASNAPTTVKFTIPSSPSDYSNNLATADMQQVSVDASIENLAVYVYGAAQSAAAAGTYGSVPAAVSAFLTTVKGQHVQHAAAFNAILTAASDKAQTNNDQALVADVTTAFGQAKTVAAVAALALSLEQVAAATYQVGSANLGFKNAAVAAATIMPVEMQHAAILSFILGKYPGSLDASGNPQAFSTVGAARTTSDYSPS